LDSDDSAWLYELGWDARFAEGLARLGDPLLLPGRVGVDYGLEFLVHMASGTARVPALRGVREAGRQVAVGDWVGLHLGGERGRGGTSIAAILERRSAIRRKTPDVEASDQVLAANVDVVFIATALAGDFNPRRVERLLTVVYQSDASPVVLLTKADLEAADAAIAELATIAPGVPALPLSSRTGLGLEAVRRHLGRGRTAVLIGSSGVGKSTLINRLAGSEMLRTGDVHHSGQGRHVTSHRQLIVIPGGGGVIIDTPGLREIQLWAGDEALDRVFGDIEELLLDCRFSDCRHDGEPDCAAAAALAEGTLDPARWASYRKLQRELRSIEIRASARLQTEQRRKWKTLQKAAKQGRH
jgi:ribosome biogenesis GTPase / thiamine phosphate phosphatase